MIRTGQTVYQQLISVDINKNPVSAATFTTCVFRNGTEYTGLTVNVNLSHADYGIFTSSWSANTIGDYQIYFKNNNTNDLILSNIFNVRPDSEFQTQIFLGI